MFTLPQVNQLQADVSHYQEQAETALQESAGWQQSVQRLHAKLAQKAEHAADFDNMQAEVALVTFLLLKHDIHTYIANQAASVRSLHACYFWSIS